MPSGAAAGLHGGMAAERIPFTKMQGAGNDYVVINGLEHPIADPGALARATMDEVARVVKWLCSPEAAFFNGATIDFTGGEGRNWFDVALYGK